MFIVVCVCLMRKMSEHDMYGDCRKHITSLLFRRLACDGLVLITGK